MPVKGTDVQPSPDTNTPPTPVPAHVYLTPDDFGIPHRRCFTPAELAPFFYASPDTIIRMIEDAIPRALPMRKRAPRKIPYKEVAAYFLLVQGAIN